MKFLFYYLLILNLGDGLITYLGLSQELIEEANPVMSYLYGVHPLLFLGLKATLSFLLYLFIFKDNLPTKRWIKGITFLAAVIYTIAFFMHIHWLSVWSISL